MLRQHGGLPVPGIDYGIATLPTARMRLVWRQYVAPIARYSPGWPGAYMGVLTL